ncbi:MAG TPA: histidine kinase dimerization/phospho-acceptor domain-containing protein [Thermoanaerobaculia bacterium]|jgi:signal transduction histidine kinase
MDSVTRAALLGASILLALVPGQANTLDRLPGAPGFVHEVYTSGDGLPSTGIAQVLQTRDGFLWIATFAGLAGPDGGWSRPATIAVEVVPRFYETVWFRLLCAALAVAAILGLIRIWNVRQRSRRRQLERMVEERTATIAHQAERLREIDDLKSQLFANVSHELRTPLTLTLGPLQDALDGRFGPLREDLAEQIDVALRNAQRLLGLVDQLLDVARLRAGRLRAA